MNLDRRLLVLGALGVLGLTQPLAAQTSPDSVVVLPDSSAAPKEPVALFTSAQARRGQSLYQRNCIECHNAEAYTGAVFRRVWVGKSPYELWELIRTTMPEDGPGQLKLEEYSDIVAYMLRMNGYPAGDTELPAEAEKLQQLRIDPLPRPGAP
jgi:mono/diheme cytochrome c family protein